MAISILVPILAVVIGLLLVAWAPKPWIAEGGKAFLWAGAFALVFGLASASVTLAATTHSPSAPFR